LHSGRGLHLPKIYAAEGGRLYWEAPAGLDAGVLLRDTDLPTLIHRANVTGPELALDIDTVTGLGTDAAAVDFVVARLGIAVVLTRRPQLAALVAELGGLGLLQVLAFDSTGLNRALDGHPRRPGVGTAISPGLVLAHLHPAELAALPRPILAYGFVDTPEAARAILTTADSVVLRPEAASLMGAPVSLEPAGV